MNIKFNKKSYLISLSEKELRSLLAVVDLGMEDATHSISAYKKDFQVASDLMNMVMVLRRKCKMCKRPMGERGKYHDHCEKCIARWHGENEIDSDIPCGDFDEPMRHEE